MSDGFQPPEHDIDDVVVRRYTTWQGAIDDVILSKDRVLFTPTIVDGQCSWNSRFYVHLQYVERQPISNASLKFLIHKNEIICNYY